MTVKVYIPTPFRRLTGNRVFVDADGSDVGGVVAEGAEQARELDLVADAGAGAVGLDVAEVGAGDAGVGPGIDAQIDALSDAPSDAHGDPQAGREAEPEAGKADAAAAPENEI